MKKFIFILCILLGNCKEVNTPNKEITNNEVLQKYADFKEAYLYLRRWEGNYGWEFGDSGGETYGGIARNYNKNWYGWKLLDIYKRKQQIKKYDLVPELEFWVVDYYLTGWLSEGYDKLKDQRLATYLFDYRNSGPISSIHTRRILINRGYILDPNGIIDDRVIHILNNINSDEFIKELQVLRMRYYVRSAKRHPEHIRFLEGWLNRAYSIKN